MTRRNLPPRDAFTSALMAIANLLESDLAKLDYASGIEALAAHSEIERLHLRHKTGPFYRHFVPLRQRMSALLAEAYRRLFKLALANPSQTGDDPDTWAWTQLQRAVGVALGWIREWYVLACDGQNQTVRPAGSLDAVPAQTASLSIPATVPPLPPSTSWRAPSWLFGISLAFFGIGGLKTQHVPNMDSDEKLGESHTRLLLKGAQRVFLWELAAAIETVRNEETAAAGATRAEVVSGQERRTIKRKGWEQRLKLYQVIRTILSADPTLKGLKFCAELDKRHALPLLDWVEAKQWRPGLTWKEAWRDDDLRRKIRRVRQEAQRAKL
jgi:hypothetical protein